MTKTEAKNLVTYSIKERAQLEVENVDEWELLRHYYLYMAELITNTTTMSKPEDFHPFQFIQEEITRLDKLFYNDEWQGADG